MAGVLPTLLTTMLVVMESPIERLTSWLVGESEALTFSPTRMGTSKLVMKIPEFISWTSMVNVSTLLAGAIGSVVMTSGKVCMWSVEFEG